VVETETQLLLRKAEAAKALGNMPVGTLEQLTCKKKIPHVKIGRAVYYDPVDLRAWIDAKKVLPALAR
jgi:hypothetical protein